MPSTRPQPARRIVFRGLKIDLALQSVVLADGTIADREVVVHRGAVALVPMVDENHVCLVRNDRHAVGETLLEVPAGTIDEGETPDQTAQRELAEETGYRAARIEHLTTLCMSPGILDEKMYVYAATGLVAGKMALEVGEDIRIVHLSWDAALEMVRDGRIHDAKSVAALLYYHTFK